MPIDFFTGLPPLGAGGCHVALFAEIIAAVPEKRDQAAALWKKIVRLAFPCRR